MEKSKKKRWLMWLFIILGVVAVVVIAFFAIRALTGSGSYKEYDIEESADGISVRLNSVERLPMTDEKCQERVTVLTSSDDNYDCVIADVTITNNTGETYDYSYRNFGYRDPRSDQIIRTAITLTSSFEGVDVTKELTAGESHTQEVHLTLRKDTKLDDLKLVYLVDRSAEDSAEIALPL